MYTRPPTIEFDTDVAMLKSNRHAPAHFIISIFSSHPLFFRLNIPQAVDD